MDYSITHHKPAKTYFNSTGSSSQLKTIYSHSIAITTYPDFALLAIVLRLHSSAWSAEDLN